MAARASDEKPTTRPRDTLQPLAEALGLPIDQRFGTEDPPHVVAAALRALDEPALVCWRHEELPALADALLQRPAAPATWPGDCFDVVWVFEHTGGHWHLQQVPQRLLAGDRTRPIARRVRATEAA